MQSVHSYTRGTSPAHESRTLGEVILQMQHVSIPLHRKQGLDRHLEKMHGRLKLKEGKGDMYQCPKCPRGFRVANMLIDHSRDHKENIHACKECRWHFATFARLHGHCRTKHDTMHFACDTCGEDFPNNDDLYKHVKSKHVILCHICRSTFISQILLQNHMDEAHDQQQASPERR